MAEGLNRVLLLGSLGADPDLKYTQGGQAVLNLRLATSERFKKDDEWQEKTEWHSVTVWGARGEGLAKILAKGSMIFVEGKLGTTSYEKDGVKHYKTQITATNIILAGGKRSGDGGGDAGGYDGGDGDHDQPGGQRAQGKPSGGGYGRQGGNGGSQGGGRSQGAPPQQRQQRAPAPPPPEDDFSGGYNDDSSIPF